MTGQELLNRWITFIRRYVVLTDAQALVVALWSMHTWLLDYFSTTPYLEVCASTKRSGKTTVLDVLALLCVRPQQFATVRPLVVVRMIEALECRLTVTIDEAEALAAAGLGDTRSLLASGYRRGAMHAISVGSAFRKFPTFCAKAFALIGNVHPILRDRCIEIDLLRGQPQAVLSEERETAEQTATELVDLLRGFLNTRTRVPIVPAEWLRARERELWTPLVSTATLLGLHVDTMRQLQAASVDLGLLKTLPPREWHSAQEETDADERDMAERALSDLRSVFAAAETFIPSEVAITRMRAIPTAPWRGWRGTGLSEITLAALLDRYGVRPDRGQLGKGRKDRVRLRGYKLADVAAALARTATQN